MFCCGFCGQPTDKEGEPIIKVPSDFDMETAKLLVGWCCAGQPEHEIESRTVTKEMAIDAGMPDIGGMQY